MTMTREELNKAIEDLTKKLVEEGKIVEAGWTSFRLMTMPDNAPAEQIEDMRAAFYAGAYHIFTSMTTMIDPGDGEPSEAELDRMDKLQDELKEYVSQFVEKYMPVKGSA